MRSYSDYYEKKLYPLQDGVLKCVEECRTDFFLTGGTALSRAYYGHRYSDDLSFFVCADENFKSEVESVLKALAENEFHWHEDEDFVFAAEISILLLSPAMITPKPL